VNTFTLPGISGGQINLSQYAGKKILLVHTASQCQHAPQYAELHQLQQFQQLQQQYASSLVVIAIPATTSIIWSPAAMKKYNSLCNSTS